MKIIDFKTVSPLFEMERDGIKPFTTRLVDRKDKRFRALSQWKREKQWYLRITNPTTGETFCRKLVNVSYFSYRDFSEYKSGGLGYFRFDDKWLLLMMGEIVN